MTLIRLLQLIEGNDYISIPVIADKNGFDTRPQSGFKVTLCFMCEEETWVTVSTYSEILIPWYGCRVKSIQPDPDHDDSICVWLDDTEYLLETCSGYCIRKEDPDEHMG